jgi:SHS2 domain-containing protein
MPDFEEIDHTADWAFRVRAPSLEELFLRALEGMYRLGGVETAPAEGSARAIRLEAGDAESLLVAWLNEALFLLESERVALRDLQWRRFSPTGLDTLGKTLPVHAMGKSIKAATYSGLKILQTEAGFEATIVLDV